MKLFSWLSAFLALTALSARAGLEFETTVLTKTAKPSDKTVSGEFKFKVTGEKTVKINELATYCHCLKAKTKGEKMEYKSGEEGVVEVEFELGAFEGEVVKQVDVLTDDAAVPETQLGVKVTIPAIYQMEPESVHWDVGEELKAKTIKVTILDEKEIAITKVLSTRETVKAELKEVKKGREFLITLTPTTTAEPVLGLLRVETDAPYERYRKRLLFFNVTRPKADEKAGPVQPADGAAAAPAASLKQQP